MNKKIIVLIACMVFFIGCSKSATPPSSDKNTLPSISEQNIPLLPPGASTDIIVNVDGTALTRGELEQEIDRRIEMLGDRIPPEQLSQNLPQIKQNLMENIIRQFVDRTLILNEADRLNIQVNTTDISNAYKKIEASLPPGITLEEAMSQSPLGKDEIKKEIDLSIRINKFFETMLSNKWAVTTEEIKSFIAENKDSLKVPETVEARHILIQFDQNDDEKTKVEKKAKIEEIRKKIINGANFAEMAKQYSDCPSSQNGGNLGKFPRGQMVQAFEDAAFSQPVNEIGKVIESPFGYHIIQVLEHQKESIMSDDQITELIRNQKMQKGAIELIKELRNKAKITYNTNISEPVFQ